VESVGKRPDDCPLFRASLRELRLLRPQLFPQAIGSSIVAAQTVYGRSLRLPCGATMCMPRNSTPKKPTGRPRHSENFVTHATAQVELGRPLKAAPAGMPCRSRHRLLANSSIVADLGSRQPGFFLLRVCRLDSVQTCYLALFKRTRTGLSLGKRLIRKYYGIRTTPLPYAKDALEPYIDALTMEIHHDKHHGAYVTNLNKAIAGKTDLESKSIESLISNLDSVRQISEPSCGTMAGSRQPLDVLETPGPEGRGRTSVRWPTTSVCLRQFRHFQGEFEAAGLGDSERLGLAV